MFRKRRTLISFIISLFMTMTLLNGVTANASKVSINTPKVEFATPPVTEYTVGDRINFNIHSPSYGGRLEYRVVLWNDTKKTYFDLWNASNGYPTRYYTKWKPYGNNIFTLGWIISEPGSYRITVYAKRDGISNSKTLLKGMNCDSYIESVAFRVKPKVSIQSIEAIPDITVNLGNIPSLPASVKALMNDNTIRDLKVIWGAFDSSRAGVFTIEGAIEGTDKKASLKLIVNQPIFEVDNIYSINVESSNKIIVTLKNSIANIPDSWRFYIRNSQYTTSKIKTVTLSDDKKVLTLLTDFLAPGKSYTLVIDAKDYSLIVPYGSMNKTITVKDCQMQVGQTVSSSISSYTSDMELYFVSQNENIAVVDELSGKITGITAGTATINVYGVKSGNVVSYGEFNAYVGVSQLPAKKYSSGSYTDNGDGSATLSILVKDAYDEPVNNLRETDFIIENEEGIYSIDERPFVDLKFVRNGMYEITYSPKTLPVDEYLNIIVKDVLTVSDLHVKIGKVNSSKKPMAGRIYIKFFEEDEPLDYDLDEGYIEITKEDSLDLDYIQIEIIDNNINTDNVDATIKKVSGDVEELGQFIYLDDNLWELSDSFSFNRGTYRINATFLDKSNNQITITITIKIIVK